LPLAILSAFFQAQLLRSSSVFAASVHFCMKVW
jgi:hypothetical protein